jgi:subtilisin family serine protease
MATCTWRSVAAASVLLALSGCETGSDDSSEEQDLPSDSKVAPGIRDDVQAGRSRDAIVVFADRLVHLRRAAFLAAIPGSEMGSYLQGVKADLDDIKASVIQASGTRLRELSHFDNLPVMHVRIDSTEALAALEAQPEVLQIAEDLPLQAFDTAANLTLVGQPTAASAGYLGAGSTVAVLDTGTDYTRAPFGCTGPGQPATCPVILAKDIATDDGALDTGALHGTNVAGVVLQVAPSARIIALDVFDGQWAYTSTILTAIDWCVQNKAKYNIVAINLSLGGGLSKSACSIDPFAPAIAAARAAGILSAVASGNDGASTAIASPACVPAAVSVGAVYPANVGKMITSRCTDTTTAADKVACFSNSASFLTMLAPGVGITAAGITMSGTSQATPHVAGAIALLAAAQPAATADAILASLISSRTLVTDARNKVAKPRLDLPAALGILPAPAPKGMAAINGGAKYTSNPQVIVSVPTTSGTATQVCLSASTACTAWQPFATPVLYTLPGSDGVKTVYVTWKNKDGIATASPASASITLDTTGPSNGSITARLTASTLTLAWTGFRDSGSGLASYRLVSAAGVAPSDCLHGTLLYSGTATSAKISAPSVTTGFRVCAMDKAGNLGSGATTTFKLTGK